MKFLRRVCLVIALQILLGQVVYAGSPFYQSCVAIGKYSVVPKEPKHKKAKITFSEVSKVVEGVFVGVVTFVGYLTTPSNKCKSADEYFPKPYNPNEAYPF